jgi:hypothetical protein
MGALIDVLNAPSGRGCGWDLIQGLRAKPLALGYFLPRLGGS